MRLPPCAHILSLGFFPSSPIRLHVGRFLFPVRSIVAAHLASLSFFCSSEYSEYGLLTLVPLRPYRAISSTSSRINASRTLFRDSFARRARSGALPLQPSAC